MKRLVLTLAILTLIVGTANAQWSQPPTGISKGVTVLHRDRIQANDTATTWEGVNVSGYKKARLDFDVTGNTSFDVTPQCSNDTVWMSGDSVTITEDSTYSVDTMGCSKLNAWIDAESGTMTMTVYVTPYNQ